MDWSFVQRREFRTALIASLGALLLVILFWSEFIEWWYTAIILALISPFIVLWWNQRLLVLLTLAIAILIWLLLWTLYPPGPNARHAAWVLLYIAMSFGLLFFGGIGLISQFVLPVQTMKERQGVFGRLLLYALGKHGPAVSVKNAQVVSAPEERKRKGPGICLVDSNSAVALQREDMPKPPAMPVRMAGPGIVFTNAKERLRDKDVLDLRKQTRSAPNVLGLTREGIEVAANISVTFRLERLPDSLQTERNQPAYSFNPDSAFRAVYGRAVGATEPVGWTELPMVVAKETYREIISRETLDHLFRPMSPSGDDPLAEFRDTFKAQVVANPMLKERGIEVLGTRISLNPSHGEQVKGVEDQRIRNWLMEWKRREAETLAGGELQAGRIMRRARIEAQYEWVSKLTQIMQAQGAHSKRVVALRLFQALETAASDPSTRRMLPANAIEMLNNVREWLKFNE